jgi:hypothetical protein
MAGGAPVDRARWRPPGWSRQKKGATERSLTPWLPLSEGETRLRRLPLPEALMDLESVVAWPRAHADQAHEAQDPDHHD